MPHIFFKNLEKRRSTQTLVPFNGFSDLGNIGQLAELGDHIYDPAINVYPFVPYDNNPYIYMTSNYGLGAPYESCWYYPQIFPWGDPQVIPWNPWSSHWNSVWPYSVDFPQDYIQRGDQSANWITNIISKLLSSESPVSSPYQTRCIFPKESIAILEL